MQEYELNKHTITRWALDYASYEDLEYTAKALYQLYATRQKEEKPEAHKKAKQYKHNMKKGNR